MEETPAHAFQVRGPADERWRPVLPQPGQAADRILGELPSQTPLCGSAQRLAQLADALNRRHDRHLHRLRQQQLGLALQSRLQAPFTQMTRLVEVPEPQLDIAEHGPARRVDGSVRHVDALHRLEVTGARPCSPQRVGQAAPGAVVIGQRRPESAGARAAAIDVDHELRERRVLRQEPVGDTGLP
jgi:hypothetical protein